MAHEHKATETRDEVFSAPVSVDENPVAHGGICRVEFCSCGAQRRTNINAGQRERGEWSDE